MVQMKDCCYILKPLGLCKLYIPHGSDESTKVDCRFKCIYNLYIPHGSDESAVQLNALVHKNKHFISHMVQMKERRR